MDVWGGRAHGCRLDIQLFTLHSLYGGAEKHDHRCETPDSRCDISSPHRSGMGSQKCAFDCALRYATRLLILPRYPQSCAYLYFFDERGAQLQQPKMAAAVLKYPMPTHAWGPLLCPRGTRSLGTLLCPRTAYGLYSCKPHGSTQLRWPIIGRPHIRGTLATQCGTTPPSTTTSIEDRPQLLPRSTPPQALERAARRPILVVVVRLWWPCGSRGERASARRRQRRQRAPNRR